MKQSLFSVCKDCFQSIIEVFGFSNYTELFQKIIILTIAFLAPVSKTIFAVLFLIFVDLISGLAASMKEKQTITSSGLSRTIGKTFIYCTTIIVAYVVNKYLLVDFDFPIESIVSGFIAITESKSILENLNRLSEKSLLADLILMFSNEREKRLPPKKTKKNDT